MKLTVSPLPIVDLSSISPPSPGFSDIDVSFCQKKFSESDLCRQHYESLQSHSSDVVKQCPHGFSSLRFQVKDRPFALTSFIPFPRSGGKNERRLAKLFPNKKLAVAALAQMIENMEKVVDNLNVTEKSVAAQQSMALHEIRKLNRTVKQTAERLCFSTNNIDFSIRDQIESIWKASELMSGQFDVLELIANEELANLPRTALSEPFKVFDKIARIYRQTNKSSLIRLESHHNYFPKIMVCDKTFPILASVLLGNAAKYSVQGTEIEVAFLPLNSSPNSLKITISNIAKNHPDLDQRIFQKGYRVAEDSDGTGKGLYLAQLVAMQHGSKIEFRTAAVKDNPGFVKCVFTLVFNDTISYI
jgi:signal transduction histidine kinase